ncbi:MAG: hypothetical protein IH845_00715 [Nanoarchaeota archaeon]|nr:hypothetical protein [Nanoarchaeota archaeon]
MKKDEDEEKETRKIQRGSPSNGSRIKNGFAANKKQRDKAKIAKAVARKKRRI